jgi:predicted TIM-barrel fold metal-dependent hydrolase
MTNSQATTSATVGRTLRQGLGHPVIDVDGHLQELSTFFKQDVIDYAADIGGAGLIDRVRETPLTWDDFFMRGWFAQSEEERRDAWSPCMAWWALPTNARDRSASYLPALLYERLEEIGIDFSVLYPSMGLLLPQIQDPEVRRVACRVYNATNAELYRPYADRMTPVAVIPAVTPGEAIEELDHAVGVLGFKAVAIAYVRRPVPKVAREWPDAAAYALHLDTFGLDSEHDYDPLWRRCVELGVAVGMHSSNQGFGSRRSLSSYTYNHVGCFSEAGDATAKSLLLGGVTDRFPTLNFVFLEGGVAWASSLLVNLVSHWEKRNGKAIQRLNPANLDVDEVENLFGRYGPERYRANLPRVRQYFERPEHRPEDLDDFRQCGIESKEDFKRLFVDRFFFGCEADDPLNSLAFNSAVNPFGARLQAVFGSDIGHWDVTDMSEVLLEAYELVEKNLFNEADFRDFVFTNPARLYLQGNKDFFAGTTAAEAAATLT